MSVDLSKCKVGDKVQLRNGKTANVIFISENEVAHDGLKEEGWNRWFCNIYDGKSAHGSDPEFSIVKIINKSKRSPKKPSQFGGIHKNDASSLWNIVCDHAVDAVNNGFNTEKTEEAIEKFRIKLAKIVRKYSDK